MGESPGIGQPPFDVNAWAEVELAKMLERVRAMCATGWRLKATEALKHADDMAKPRESK